jgi:hypothetical protein
MMAEGGLLLYEDRMNRVRVPGWSTDRTEPRTGLERAEVLGELYAEEFPDVADQEWTFTKDPTAVRSTPVHMNVWARGNLRL